MFPYWLLFMLFATAALTERPRAPGDHRAGPALILLCLVMVLMIGLRFEVGGDYETYLGIFERAADSGFEQALERGDPGYQIVNWLVGQWGGTMWQVNLICGAVFAWGLVRFCQRQPAPLLAALVAIPYLVIVVAMGYTRQAVAIGVIMAGLASLDRHGSIIRFVFYVALAATFHRTAVIVLPLVIFAGRNNHFLNLLAVILAAFGLYSALVEESVDLLVRNYIEARYGSEGAAIRVAMNVLPAMLFLLKSRHFGLVDYQRRLWLLVAWAAVACVPALWLVPSTTAVDRIALYLIPIQILVLSRLNALTGNDMTTRVMLVAYAFAVLFTWLNFAGHSFAWLPYQTVIGW